MKLCHTDPNNRRKRMSRIDVVPSEKGKFKVLVNLGMDGAYEYSSATLANQVAKKELDNRPDAEVHYASDN
jgi:hypothetical protein